MIRSSVARISRKAKRLLNWEPKVDLEEALRLTLDFFKEQFAKETLAGSK